ncbi:MAG: outer membrane lipoprotein-sorting protein [Desulfobacteraceae bacterium]|nr:outer membrane lipoprotein-sorting protein [Desulfobacteraceae bacterium]
MQYILKTILVCSMLIITGLNVSYAETMRTPDEILKLADLSRGSSTGLEWTIKIESIEGGKKQKNTIRLKTNNFNSLAEFLSPAKVKGRKLLMKDRNMWFVKPGLSKPVPISPRQKLLGGASNGDIASTNYSGDYTITKFSEDGDFDGKPCFLFDLKANTKKVTYDRIRYFISKEKLIGVKAEFYTISGKLFKTATFEYDNSIKTNNKSRLFVSRMIIQNAVFKHDITTMDYSKIKIKKISDATFNINLLLK